MARQIPRFNPRAPPARNQNQRRNRENRNLSPDISQVRSAFAATFRRIFSQAQSSPQRVASRRAAFYYLLQADGAHIVH
jgi:hypothetical protein